MTELIDLGPAATRVGEVVTNIPDSALTAPTPCPKYTVGDLLEHVGGLSLAFTAAAEKTSAELGGAGPSGDASRLPADWRTQIPASVDTLAAAWRDPDAWTGMTQAGGIDMPGEIGGLVALDELVLHGWDLARATGQDYDLDETTVGACYQLVEGFAGQDNGDAFGPPVAIDQSRPLLDRLVALSGRDPDWTPAR